MAGLGDFLRLAPPPGFVTPWDTWVQALIRAGRVRLGGHWTACYFAAPIWRFSLPAGLAGPAAVLGVMMPSVDRVGRHFPLTLVAATQGRRAAAHTPLEPVFARLEDIALNTLDGDQTATDLAHHLQAVAVTALPAADPAAGPGDSLWSALLPDRLLTFRCTGLPRPDLPERLFAPLGTEAATDPAEGAAP